MFHDYLRDVPANGMRKALVELFRVLDQKPEDRDPYLADDNPKLAAFPYVNGGLFADEGIELPSFTDELKEVLLSKASEGFDWSQISPTIFGAVFESTLNPATRRSGGMHYTSIENIHKVIDPLFLDDLKKELENIKSETITKTRKAKLEEFQNKLSALTFLDPACGSGNFLTESYLCLRRLENETISELYGDQIIMGAVNPIKVQISQFYGIEINDFAVSVAKTAMWIAEYQMLRETEGIVHTNIDFLPLHSYTSIHEGNSLRTKWQDLVNRDSLSYIMGNPPFLGYSMQNKDQKADILSVYIDEHGKPYKMAGKIDYVAGWYYKAAQMMEGTNIRAAFVSTNSITQGEQVAGVWKPLVDQFGVHIDFAHRTFRWDSEASIKAHVYCVIVGFSIAPNQSQRKLFSAERMQCVQTINPYLIEAPTVFIESRTKPIADVPTMSSGGKPVEGGNLIFTEEEKEEFLAKEPNAARFFKRFIGSEDFINGYKRWCLWLLDITPKELHSMPNVLARVKAVKDFRLTNAKAATRAAADCPTRFMEIKQPEKQFLIVPEVSSDKRKYIPIGYVSDMICSNKVRYVSDATLYHFGVLTSNVHMAWMRTVCGRLGMSYSYSINIVYNNFPWPSPTDAQREKIERTAQAILDARALYPDSSLADLYDELTMPPELRKAHQQNDKAVMEAYGFNYKTMTESSCVAELMRMYQQLTETK